MYLFCRFRGQIVCSLLFLIISGCSGMEPYTPPNQREDGPESGLFSGSAGGFILYQSGEEETVPENRNRDKVKMKEAESSQPTE